MSVPRNPHPVRQFGLAAVLAIAALGSRGLAQAQAPTASATAPAADPTRLFADSQLKTEGRMSIEVVGQGPDLILIPGLASSRATWRATAERLRGHYRLHLIQVAGFAGLAPGDNAGPEVLVPTAEAIDAYIVRENLAPAVVIGHSLGGTMALYLAERHPEHLKKVLLVDALPYMGVLMAGPKASPGLLGPIAKAIRERAGKGPAPDATKQLQAMVSSPDNQALLIAWSKASDPGVVGRAFADDIMLDLRPDLAKLTVPVTLLYPDEIPAGAPQGAMDSFYATQFAEARPKTLVRIDASRHFIMLDQPAAFAAQLDAFLAR